MKILVTGGAGMIGSHLVDYLVKLGHDLIVIDDLSGGKEKNLPMSTINFYEEDCRNFKQINDIFSLVKPDIVYHLAANAAENKAQFSPIDITSRNYDSFIKVLTASINNGCRKFIFTSSIAVYGALQTPFKETDDPKPEDLYGITKLAAEETLKVMGKVHDLEWVIARPHNVYGPKQNMADPYRNVMTIWMNALLRGEPYYIYGDGSMRRCFSYIDDVVEALVKCLDIESGQIFNIGSDNSYSLIDLSNKLREVTGSIIMPKFLPKRAQEVQEAISDHTECKSMLGYNETDLLEGMMNTWKYCKEQGPQEPIYTELEIDSPKVPSNWRKNV